jgi:hypothetical protein
VNECLIIYDSFITSTETESGNAVKVGVVEDENDDDEESKSDAGTPVSESLEINKVKKKL